MAGTPGLGQEVEKDLDQDKKNLSQANSPRFRKLESKKELKLQRKDIFQTLLISQIKDLN